jgi:hypothetical protein
MDQVGLNPKIQDKSKRKMNELAHYRDIASYISGLLVSTT